MGYINQLSKKLCLTLISRTLSWYRWSLRKLIDARLIWFSLLYNFCFLLFFEYLKKRIETIKEYSIISFPLTNIRLLFWSIWIIKWNPFIHNTEPKNSTLSLKFRFSTKQSLEYTQLWFIHYTIIIRYSKIVFKNDISVSPRNLQFTHKQILSNNTYINLRSKSTLSPINLKHF